MYIYIYITRLTSNEIFKPSKIIHREVDWAKDLSAPPVPYGRELFSLLYSWGTHT